MKEMNNTENFTDEDWINLASILSEEKVENTDLLSRFMAEDIYNTVDQWKELKNMNSETKINVDKAWENVQARIKMDNARMGNGSVKIRFSGSAFLRIAAVAIILLSLGTVGIYLGRNGAFSRNITYVTGNDQKNLLVSLPDGSSIIMNRNTELSYRTNFGKRNRDVKLKGEAFFEISPDVLKPFIIDAGTAKVKVVGTTFNVRTNSNRSEVEVYVKTGKVLLSDNSGVRSLELDPEFVGRFDLGTSLKEVNKNPNYLAWKTEKLFYNGQKLGVVFNDLKRVYNMDIVAEDPGINDNVWTSPIDTQSQDTIIRLICTSFNLSYAKDGAIYHLRKK
jgi:transmembrane sensor